MSEQQGFTQTHKFTNARLVKVKKQYAVINLLGTNAELDFNCRFPSKIVWANGFLQDG